MIDYSNSESKWTKHTKMRFISVIILVLLVSGCVSLRVPTTTTHFQTMTPQQRALALAKINQWKIEGALSIVQANQQPEIANYQWQQLALQNYHIVISSALNLYRVVIDSHHNIVTLSKNGTFVASAKTPKQLMQKAVGWSLPISAMQYWIKGLPSPQKKFVAKYDGFGHLIFLQQSGWTLHYQAYQTQWTIDLPQMITLQRPGLYAKVVIRRWGDSDSDGDKVRL